MDIPLTSTGLSHVALFFEFIRKKQNEVEAAHGVFVCLFVFSFGQISLILYYCMFPIFLFKWNTI